MSAHGEKILVVDDNDIVRETITEMLTSIGYEVVGATGGRAGVVLAERERFELILMDISMPMVDGVPRPR
ncbi:MAG: response regulator [Pseudomonadota bacterium]